MSADALTTEATATPIPARAPVAAPARDVHWTEAARRAATDAEIDRARVPAAFADAVRRFDAELLDEGYLAAPAHVLGLYTAIVSGRPMLLYGPPGGGKTFLAEVLARILNPGLPLIAVSMNKETRPEDLLYRDDRFGRKVLWKQLEREARERLRALDWDDAARRVQAKVVPGPLARAILEGNARRVRRVVLIDEVDKATEGGTDPLLYYLNSGEIPIPYLGILRPEPGTKPVVVLTANTEYLTFDGKRGNERRRLSEALESRVYATQVQVPTVAEEAFVLKKQVPLLDEDVLEVLLLYTHRVREVLRTAPISVREVRNFAEALSALGFSGPHALAGPFLGATVGYYAKNAADEYALRLHAEEALRWVYREIDRYGSARAKLEEVDALQRKLRAGDSAPRGERRRTTSR